MPLTNLQESLIQEGATENRQVADYYCLDLGPKVDLIKFKESCHQILKAFPILRASFVPFDRKYWMVIPKHLDMPFYVTDVDLGLQDALMHFCLHDMATFERNQPIIAFVLLQHKTQGTQLVVRLSHAQYDSISIEIIFKRLLGAYRGEAIPEYTSFSTYIAYTFRQRARSILYWRKLLKGSKYTDFGVHLLPKIIPESMPIPFRIDKEIISPKTPTGITTASLMSAAWAVFLSIFLKEGEVIYGSLVTGRNSAIPGVEEVVGPCINIVPVRVNFSSHRSTTELVLSIQEQSLSLGEADSLGYIDVVEHCTDWPAGARIYSCTIYQNVDECGVEFEIEGFTSRLWRVGNHRRLPYLLYLFLLPRGGDKLSVQIFAHSHMAGRETVQAILDGYCLVVENLAAGLEVSSSMADLMDRIEIPARLQHSRS